MIFSFFHALWKNLSHKIKYENQVLFAGYTIPHPAEDQMHLRIQTAPDYLAQTALKWEQLAWCVFVLKLLAMSFVCLQEGFGGLESTHCSHQGEVRGGGNQICSRESWKMKMDRSIWSFFLISEAHGSSGPRSWLVAKWLQLCRKTSQVEDFPLNLLLRHRKEKTINCIYFSTQEHLGRGWRPGPTAEVLDRLQPGHWLYKTTGCSARWRGENE